MNNYFYNSEEIERKRQLEAVKREVFTKFLTKEARERLSTLRYAHPSLAESVENMIIQAALSNRIRGVIDDKKLKELLASLNEENKGGG
ncbi:MAG: DNA-binding protein [Candidatus Parvarchaeota archaeon]|nr:DNA-binding protein [Candidatus Parvarchaeota archaeon]MCW1301633.1 DNA-binding protein [Candidatus Parvarchaeota archaeon]